jgi:UDP-N-acetylmuramate--alanine ligase
MKYKVKDLPVIIKPKKIFFVGIKGVGVCPLAIIAKQAGFEVAGSDIGEQFITDTSLEKEHIKVFEDFKIDDISSFFADLLKEKCLVVTTGAHKGFDNPQVKWAKDMGINILTQGQAVGIFMDGEIFGRDDIQGISIAGSHGKTTITSLLASSMTNLELDPSFTIGTGEVFPLGVPGHFGKGEYFIVEADEYASEPVFDKIPKFLYQKATYAIFNNIDFDHPDLFSDVGEIKEAFYEFALNIKSGGKLFINGDDKYLKDFKTMINKDIKIVTFGEGGENDFVISKTVLEGMSSRFTVSKHDKELGVFELNIPGIVNAKNALPVIALLFEIGIEYRKIREALKVFTGSKRRMENVGMTQGGALVIDDYAHHPLEISVTLDVIRKVYKDKKIITIFQPHTYSRTKVLLAEFSKAFKDIDTLILLPVFKSLRDTENDILSKEEYEKGFSQNKNVIFLENFGDVVEYVNKNCQSSDFVIVTIGAGDVYKIAYQLIKI